MPMQIAEQYAGVSVPFLRCTALHSALLRASSVCWWLTLAMVTVDAAWNPHLPGGSSIQLFWFDLPLLATVALWAMALLVDPMPTLTLGPRVPLVLVTGIAALALASVTVAGYPHLALAMGARLVLVLVFYLYTVNRAYSDAAGPCSARGLFAGALAAGFAVQGVVALGQTLRQASLGLGMVGERSLDIHTSGIAVVEAHGQHWLRPYGLTAHPNLLGGFLAASLLPMAFWLPHRVARVAVPACMGLLLLTLSRGAFLAALCGIAIYMASGHRLRLPRPGLVIAGCLALIGLVLLTPAVGLVAARFNAADPLEQFSIGERLSSQGTAVNLVREHPLLGVGADNYLAVVQAQSGDREGGQAYVPVVHNAYLLAASEIGLGGAALLIGALLWPAWRLLRCREARIAAPASCGLVACAVLGLVDFYPWSSPAFNLLWVTLLGFWAAGVAPARRSVAGIAA